MSVIDVELTARTERRDRTPVLAPPNPTNPTGVVFTAAPWITLGNGAIRPARVSCSDDLVAGAAVSRRVTSRQVLICAIALVLGIVFLTPIGLAAASAVHNTGSCAPSVDDQVTLTPTTSLAYAGATPGDLEALRRAGAAHNPAIASSMVGAGGAIPIHEGTRATVLQRVPADNRLQALISYDPTASNTGTIVWVDAASANC